MALLTSGTSCVVWVSAWLVSHVSSPQDGSSVYREFSPPAVPHLVYVGTF